MRERDAERQVVKRDRWRETGSERERGSVLERGNGRERCRETDIERE